MVLNDRRLFYRELSKTRRLDDREQSELIKRAQGGDGKARNRVVEANLPLAVYIARKRSSNWHQFMDYFQEGSIALADAIRGYDFNTGVKFGTYAGIAIRNRITSSRNRTPLVHIPCYVVEYVQKLKRILPNACREESISLDEVMGVLDVSEIDAERVLYGLAAMKGVVYESGLRGVEFQRWINLTQGDSVREPWEILADNEKNEAIKSKAEEVLSCVNSREKEVLRMRHGFDKSETNFKKIGEHVGVGEQQAANIYRAAIRSAQIACKSKGRKFY